MHHRSVVLLCALALISCTKRAEPLPVTDFESCAAAGNPVMESYPRQCRSDDGRLFVEQIERTPIVNSRNSASSSVVSSEYPRIPLNPGDQYPCLDANGKPALCVAQ